MYNNYPWYGYPAYGYNGGAYEYMMRQNGNNNGNGNGNGMLPVEQSYIENILRLNDGKYVHVYMTFENNPDRPSCVFSGTIEAAGRDHIIIRDPDTNKRYLLLMVYLDYVVFDEEINYDYPYNDVDPAETASYPPR